jgi:hypothetical protein
MERNQVCRILALGGLAAGVSALIVGLLAVMTMLTGADVAHAETPVTLVGGTSNCPIAVSPCSYKAVSTAILANLTSQTGFSVTVNLPGLSATGVTVTKVSSSSFYTDSVQQSLALEGTLSIGTGVPFQFIAYWGSPATPQVAVSVTPSGGSLGTLNAAWSGAPDPSVSNTVLVASPDTGYAFTPSVLPIGAQPFYPTGMTLTTPATAGAVSLYGQVTPGSGTPLAHALSYLGLGSSALVTGTLADSFAAVTAPGSSQPGLALTVAGQGVPSAVSSWVSARSASVALDVAAGTASVTMADQLTTDIAGAVNVFTATAGVDAATFGTADIAVSYQLSGSSFAAPFGLSALSLSGTTLGLTVSTAPVTTFTGSLESTVSLNNRTFPLRTTLVVAGSTVSGSFSLGGSVTLVQAVQLANTLLGTTAALPPASQGGSVSLSGVTFSFSTGTGKGRYALTAQTNALGVTANALVSVDDTSGTPKIFAGINMANVQLPALLGSTQGGAASLVFPELNLFVSSGYLNSGGTDTSVPWGDLLPAQQQFFTAVYPGTSPPSAVTFGPTVTFAGSAALPEVLTGTLGLTGPIVFAGSLGFGLDSLGSTPAPTLSGTLTATLPAVTAGLPTWLAGAGSWTATITADTSGAVSLAVHGAATAAIEGSTYPVDLTGTVQHTSAGTSVTLVGGLTGTFQQLFGTSWLSLSNPAVALALTDTPTGRTAMATVTGSVGLGDATFDAALALQAGGGSSATVSLRLASGSSGVGLASLADSLAGTQTSALPSVTLTALDLTGSVSSSGGAALDVVASTHVSLPGTSAPFESTFLLNVHAGGGKPASVLAGFAPTGTLTLADLAPGGTVPVNFTLPSVGLLVASPATKLTMADLSPAEQAFFASYCGATDSACHTTLAVPSGVSIVASFPVPDALTPLLAQVHVPTDAPVLLTGTAPVFGSGSFALTLSLPTVQVSSAPDFFHSGQLNLAISTSGLSLNGTMTFNIAKGASVQSAAACTDEGGVWRAPRGGGPAACYDQVPFSIAAQVSLAPLSIMITGGLGSGYAWQDPMGATWLTLTTAKIQFGISVAPTLTVTLGFSIGASIDGHDFSGALVAGVTVAPPLGIDPVLDGFRLASSSGLSMADLVSLANAVSGSQLTLDNASLPNLGVRNVLFSYSALNDPALCLPLGIHIAGDLYVNPGTSALSVSSEGCDSGAPTVDRTALCAQDSANGCLAGVDVKIDKSGITASGLLGSFNAGALNFKGATVDLAITPASQHLVIAGALTVPGFLSGSADLLISPMKMEFRGSASVFDTALQAYLDGTRTLSVPISSLSDIENSSASFSVTAVLQTTFLHQTEVAIAVPLEKLRPVLQVVATMLADAQQGDVLGALTVLPTDLANLGGSLPPPYGSAMQTLSDGLATMSTDLAKVNGTATLSTLMAGATLTVPGIPGVAVPAGCITTWSGGACWTTPPIQTKLGTIPGTPGTVIPATCITTEINGICYSVPPLSVTIPGICPALQKSLPNLDCSSPQSIVDTLISPVLKLVITKTTGYDMSAPSAPSLTTFLDALTSALASGNAFDLTCAQFHAAAQLSSTPNAQVSLAAAGSVFSKAFNLGLGWSFAPNSSNVTADVVSLIQNLITPTATSGSCGLPANWNANPDFPGISGSISPDAGTGSSGGSGSGGTPPPPTLTTSLTSSSIVEGSSATVTGTLSPVPLSPVALTVTWGDGTSSTLNTGSDGAYTAAHRYPDLTPAGVPSAQYLVSVHDTADSLTANATLTVTEAVPSALNIQSVPPTPEGSPVTLSGSFNDPATEPHVVTANWGDGSTSSITLAADANSFTGLSHTYTDGAETPGGTENPAWPVTVTVSADNSAASTQVEIAVPVTSVAPSAILIVPVDTGGSTVAASTPEQTPVTFGVSFTHPGTADPLTASVDFGDGSPPVVVALGTTLRTFTLSHLWTEADTASHPDGNFPVTVTIGDSDSKTDTSTVIEHVVNVAPSALLACLPDLPLTGTPLPCPATTTITEGSAVSLLGSFVDPSAADTHLVTIDWGPGWPAATRVQSLSLPAGTFGFTAARSYGDEGTFPVQVTVTDDDGASMVTTDVVTVLPVVPSVALNPVNQTSVQGVPAYLTQAGSSVGLSGSVSAPGNDNIAATWSFGDSLTAAAGYPLDPPTADLAGPEDPTNAPVSATDAVTHTWATPCVYPVSLAADNGDGPIPTAVTDAVVTGTDPKAWQSGYWIGRFRRGLTPTLTCELGIVTRMSALFAGSTSVPTPASPIPLTTAAEAAAVLAPGSPSQQSRLQREILTLWLDYASGAFTYNEPVHPHGSPTPSPTFSTLMVSAEELAADPTATTAQLRQMRQTLDGLIG